MLSHNIFFSNFRNVLSCKAIFILFLCCRDALLVEHAYQIGHFYATRKIKHMTRGV